MKSLQKIAAITLVAFCLVSVAPPVAVAYEEPAEQLISMDFEDAPIKNVLKILSQQSALNFVTSEGVEVKKVTVYFEDVTVQDALDSIVNANGLRYEKKNDNLYIIYPAGITDTGTETRVFTLKYTRLSSSPIDLAGGSIIQELTAASDINAIDTTTATASSDSGGSSSSSTGASSKSSSSKENVITGRGVDTLIGSMLSDKGKVAIDLNTNSLIVTDTPQTLKQIEKVLEKIDVPSKQVMIEVHIMEVRRNLLEDHGFDWGGSNGALGSLTGGSKETGFPFQVLSGSRTGVNENRDITLGTVSASNLTVTLRMITSDTKTKILARPRVLTMNNEAAQIKLVTNTAIANQVVTTASEGQSAQTTNTAERAPTGIILKMTPQINQDQSINLYVEPSVTTAVASSFFPSTFLDPTTRSVRTLARVKNNETLVLGGLIDSDYSTAMKKIPGLGDLPIFGKAFNYKDRGDLDRELLIFITPHIVEGNDSFTVPSEITTAGKEPASARMMDAFRDGELERTLNAQEQTEIKRHVVIGDELGIYRTKAKTAAAAAPEGMEQEMANALEMFSQGNLKTRPK